MSAQLPYLPPMNRTFDDVKSIASGAAEDVRNSTGLAAKAGNVVRGALAAVPAAVRGVNDTLAAPVNAIAGQVGSFARNLAFGPDAPTLGLPTIANPQPAPTAPVAAAPTIPTFKTSDEEDQFLRTANPRSAEWQGVMNRRLAAVPATQAPVATPANGAPLTVTRDGNKVTIMGDQPSGPPATRSLPVMYRPDPIALGIQRQAAYADQQRQAVLNAADVAAASGNEGNASLRYAAALHGLPALSGANSFASTGANLSAEQARTAEAERSNIRTTEATRYGAELSAENVRRQIQSVVIGQQPNPDPVTKMIHPFIPIYGVATIGKDGKPVVTDMQGRPPGGAVEAAPMVGSRTSQKDGSYKHGDKTVTIKGGVITEVK